MWMRSERLRKKAEMLHQWRKYAQKIAEASSNILGEDVDVHVFGSVVKGEATAASDIDILIVTNRTINSLTERNRLGMMIEEIAGLPQVHPFEIHIVTKDEAEPYFRHAGSNIMRLEKSQKKSLEY